MVYNYNRPQVEGIYKIDNPDRVDGEGKQIHLSIEIQTEFPSYPFSVRCFKTDCNIEFVNRELTTEEKTSLDTIVSNHINNT